MAHTMRAILLAKAIAASLRGLRSSKDSNQGDALRLPGRACRIPTVDPAPGILWVASIHEGTTTPGMQAAPAGHFEVREFVRIPGGGCSLLLGAANQGTDGLICSDFIFAAVITAIDLTSATFARSSGNAAIHPHVMIGF